MDQTPSRHVRFAVDKENLTNDAAASPMSVSQKTPFSTPLPAHHHSQQQQHVPLEESLSNNSALPAAAATRQLFCGAEPPKSTATHSTNTQSKLLRQHFEQMALTPQRRLLDSGAVRVESHKKKKKPRAITPKQQQQRRIGYDGTPYTPSKQLLQSTTASRNQARRDPVASILHNQGDEDSFMSSEDTPKDVTSDLQLSPQVVRPVVRRHYDVR